MEDLMKQWKANSAKKSEENFAYFRRLKMKSKNKVDSYAKQLHEEAFEYIDCLKCGNCCKVSQPLISKSDLKRIAEYLDLSPTQLKEKYLELNEEDQWVTKTKPCPFLNLENNQCNIYEVRPKVCKEFPHTQKPGFAGRRYLHTANVEICPATYYILEEMKYLLR